MKAKTVVVLIATFATLAFVSCRISQRPVETTSDPIAPRWVNPKTGELLTSGEKADKDKDLNSDALKEQRALSLRVIQNPQAHTKRISPVFPPKTTSYMPDFDMAHPELFVRAMREKETTEQRVARELSKLAIEDPAAYVAELKRRAVYPQFPGVEPGGATQSKGEKEGQK